MTNQRPSDGVVSGMQAMTRSLAEGRDSTWSLPPVTASVATARDVVHRSLEASRLTEPVDTALIVSELVTNAVVHGGPPIQLTVRVERSPAASELVCEVTDSSPLPPELRHGGLEDEGGRGLQLVDLLSQSWGTRPAGHGKTVWARLTLPDSHARHPRRRHTHPDSDCA